MSSVYETDALIAEDIEAYLAQHQQKSLLRFITCGSVDDGKSTLMRLLALRSTRDSGRVTKRGDVNVGYLDQSDVLDGDLTVGA
ncbi:MAG: hypothetical protein ACK4S7_11500, partial [Sphingorhabdus sp.]